MINASKEFKEKLKKGAKLSNFADVMLADGTVLHLEPKDFMIGGCQIEDKATDGKFGVGFVMGKTLLIRLENDDERFSQYDFYMSVMTLYVGMLLDNGSVEKIRKGVYYVMVPQTQGDIIEINAVDSIFKLDKDYAGSSTVYPATLQAIISDTCLDCGIPIGFRQFDNMNFTVREKPENVTYRQVISYACQIAGYNARIDVDGYMQLVWYNTSLLDWHNYNGGSFKTYPHDTVLDGGDFKDYSRNAVIDGGEFMDPMPEHIFRIKSLQVHTDDVVITGVRVTGEDEAVALFGEEGYVIDVKGNPFVNGQEKSVADYLGGRMVGMVFRPFTAQVLGNPLYEPVEVVRVSDRKGNVYYSIVNSVSYTIGGFTQIACQAEDPVRNGSSYFSPEAAAAVAEARRNAEKQISTYDKAVQNMNQLAMNAMGFHTTYEDQPDGSRITYFHDKPTIADSKTVYKQNADGFFVSSDGGKSYTNGFDKNGNAIVNILYAIGIVCDWIRGGTLTLGGDDNVNGVLNLLNAAKELVARMDKDGLAVYKGSIRGTTLYLGGISDKDGVMYVRDAGGNTVGRFDKSGLYAANGYFNGTIESTSATITGGSFNVETASEDYSAISLRYGSMCIKISPYKIDAFDGNNEIEIGSNGSIAITQNGVLGINMGPSGNFYARGSKNRVVKTQNYSDRLLYCYETPKPYFGDIGEGVLDETGVCYVFLDDIFSETINTECGYQVFLQKYAKGDAWIEDKSRDYFIVKGTPHLKFGWELKARQAGYEEERLEKFELPCAEAIINYENEAERYIENYYREALMI